MNVKTSSQTVRITLSSKTGKRPATQIAKAINNSASTIGKLFVGLGGDIVVVTSNPLALLFDLETQVGPALKGACVEINDTFHKLYK